MSAETSTPIEGWSHSYSGKVRDLYISQAFPNKVLMVASDRVSAFDHVLEPGIPGKGALLTELSLWWFGQLSGVPNHLVVPQDIPAEVRGRAVLVKTLDMYPIECVVRGYLSGSGWVEYQQSQSVCGIPLPAGLSDGERLPEPIYTPAWKAPMGEHDENITFERTVELVGEAVATALRDLSLVIFSRASVIAEARGILLADTKFEFGMDEETGLITLADEVLTSDSSRFWDASLYGTGDRTASFDKQIVRNWLLANWDKQGTPPELPTEIVEQTAARYRELIERLTGIEATA
jgi:phosphoribosylaminoimidazole-succinocarboxamide synthase